MNFVSPRVDDDHQRVHFWDPMQDQSARTDYRALESAAVPFARSMMFTTIIMTTTRMRGAAG